jgi:hypothetical protein
VGEVAPKLLYLERTGVDLRPSHPLDALASAIQGAVPVVNSDCVSCS